MSFIKAVANVGQSLKKPAMAVAVAATGIAFSVAPSFADCLGVSFSRADFQTPAAQAAYQRLLNEAPNNTRNENIANFHEFARTVNGVQPLGTKKLTDVNRAAALCLDGIHGNYLRNIDETPNRYERDLVGRREMQGDDMYVIGMYCAQWNGNDCSAEFVTATVNTVTWNASSVSDNPRYNRGSYQVPTYSVTGQSNICAPTRNCN